MLALEPSCQECKAVENVKLPEDEPEAADKPFNVSLQAPSAQRRLGSLSLTYNIDMHSRFWPDIGSGGGRWAKIPLRCQ